MEEKGIFSVFLESMYNISVFFFTILGEIYKHIEYL